MLVFDTQVVHFLAAPMVCYPPALDTALCSAARLSTPAPPEPLPHLYASANQLPFPDALALTEGASHFFRSGAFASHRLAKSVGRSL